jgi:hypothetical protein
MTDVLAVSHPKLPTGSTLTPLVDRLSKHADVNRPGHASKPEFSGLLEALSATSEIQSPTSASAVTGNAAASPVSPVSTAELPVAPSAAKAATKRYDHVATAKER